MNIYNLGGCHVELDIEETVKWYETSNGWGCDCSHCRNFLQLAKKRALSKNTLDVLDELGIPLEKATYVGELFTDEEGVHYQFSYRLVGTILDNLGTPSTGYGDVGRCCHEPYPYGAPGFPEPHFDLEFYETLPWVLEE